MDRSFRTGCVALRTEVSADAAARQRFHVRSRVRVRERDRVRAIQRLEPHPHKPFRFNRFLSSNFGCWSGTFNGQPVDLKEVPSGEPRLLCSTPPGVTCHPRHPLRSSAPKSESVAGPSARTPRVAPNALFAVGRAALDATKLVVATALFENRAPTTTANPRRAEAGSRAPQAPPRSAGGAKRSPWTRTSMAA